MAFLSNMEIFLFVIVSGLIDFSHYLFSALDDATGIALGIGPECPWPKGNIWKNDHIHEKLYI